MKTINNQSDHDLLIKLDQKVTDVQIAVKDLSTGTFIKIASLEKDKADREVVDELQKKVNIDIETRVRKLEDKTATYKIAFALYSIAVGFMIALTIYHILSVK